MLTFIISYIFFILWEWLQIAYLHRSLTHKQFEFHPIMVQLIKILAWMTLPRYYTDWGKRWTAGHRMHHAYSDTDKDTHSPHHMSFTDIFFMKRYRLTNEEIESWTKDVKITVTKLDKLMEKLPIGRVVFLIIMVSLFSWIGFLIWLACINSIYLSTFFNYIGHGKIPGYTNGPNTKSDKSKNLPYLGFVYISECLHANHHKWPSSANMAVRWWEVDFGYWILKFLSLFGLVTFNKTALMEKTI